MPCLLLCPLSCVLRLICGYNALVVDSIQIWLPHPYTRLFDQSLILLLSRWTIGEHLMGGF
ncbi:hypothetical protein BDA96_01G291600 [Sorghum bicolor]|uniref:Uncharacterized protein n=1 Tax=Sorghum bicolor TaxID=4558 RepID=A0A921S1Y4_SORBI|nr:hypothetical protein BDA96_01G291600 [Sorghum bicolor]